MWKSVRRVVLGLSDLLVEKVKHKQLPAGVFFGHRKPKPGSTLALCLVVLAGLAALSVAAPHLVEGALPGLELVGTARFKWVVVAGSAAVFGLILLSLARRAAGLLRAAYVRGRDIELGLRVPAWR